MVACSWSFATTKIFGWGVSKLLLFLQNASSEMYNLIEQGKRKFTVSHLIHRFMVDVCAEGFRKSTKTRETSINYRTENMNKKKMATRSSCSCLPFSRVRSRFRCSSLSHFCLCLPIVGCVTKRHNNQTVGCNVIFVLRRWKHSDTHATHTHALILFSAVLSVLLQVISC